MKESLEPMNISEPHRVTKDEWEKLKDLRLRALADSPRAFGSTLEGTKDKPEETWLKQIENTYTYAIEAEGQFVALAVFRKDDDGVWTINGVWTDPKFRRRGLSKKLFSEILKQAEELSVKTIELSVNATQSDAIELYKQSGFEIVETREDQLMGDGNTYNEYIMRMNLNQTNLQE